MKNKKSCSLCENITKILNINYVKNSKFLILIPVIIIALAIAITSLFGVNYAENLRNSYQFTVDFGVEIQEDKEKDYQDKVKEALTENNLVATNFLKKGEVVYTSYVVTIDSAVSNLTEDEITEIQEKLEESLKESIDSTIEVSELLYSSAKMDSNILISLLGLLVAVICMFIYIWIRHNIAVATSMTLSTVLSTALMFVFFGLFRIPFDQMSLALLLIAPIINILVSMYIFNEIKNRNMEEKTYTNNEYVYEASTTLVKNVLVAFAWIVCAIVVIGLIMFIFNLRLALGLIGLMFAIIVALYTSLFISTSCWANMYNKAKDVRLRNRLEKRKKSEEKKSKKSENKVEEEKIVV